VGYVGLVASRTRGAAVLAEVQPTDCERARVHTPVGLPIGARTPAEIAVSIAAELIADLRAREHPAPPEPDRPSASAAEPGCHAH
jgi:xanthine dehydrogenase accessory factor